MIKLFLLISLVFGISSVSSQSAEPPVSDDACTALKSIASDTQGTIAPCIVQEGCGVLVCNSIAGMAKITLQPCTDPPSFLTQFFDTTNTLVYEQNMTGNNSYTIPLGSTIMLLFEVKQFDDDALSVKVDANIGGSVSPFIPETKVPSSKCLCEGSTSLTECATMAATTIATTTVMKISTSEPAVIVSVTSSSPPPAVIAPSSARATTTTSARNVVTMTATPGAAMSSESPTAGSGLSIVSLPAMMSLLMLFTAFIMLLT